MEFDWLSSNVYFAWVHWIISLSWLFFVLVDIIISGCVVVGGWVAGGGFPASSAISPDILTWHDVTCHPTITLHKVGRFLFAVCANVFNVRVNECQSDTWDLRSMWLDVSRSLWMMIVKNSLHFRRGRRLLFLVISTPLLGSMASNANRYVINQHASQIFIYLLQLTPLQHY